MYDRSFYEQPKRRTPDPKPIGEAIKEFLSAQKWSEIYESQKLQLAWAEIVGGFVANQTKKVQIRGEKLFVHVSQPTLRYEILMQKTQLIYRVNAYFGKRVVSEIVLL